MFFLAPEMLILGATNTMRKLLILSLGLILGACSKNPPIPQSGTTEWIDIESDLQKLFIQAKDSSTIEIPAGHYIFKKPLLVDGKKNLTIKGAGAEKTILSFAIQEEGAEGLKISNCKNLILSDFTIEDAKGDNIKATDCKGIRFSRIVSQWTGEPKEENGAYAFYPVLCTRVVLENCIAIGASDAGIYVGQSDSVIIRNNEAYYNVAGIESENSRWVEIYGNIAHHNTGGILVFDLPGLTQFGHSTKVFKNDIYENNYRNFAPEGNVVATVPPGTGLMLLATRKIDIYENNIRNNKTAGCAIASYKMVEALSEGQSETNLTANVELAEKDEVYDPYPSKLQFYRNRFDNGYTFPSLKSDFGWLFLVKMPFNTPDLVWDGIRPPEGHLSLCTQDENIAFADLDAANDFENLSTDLSTYQCSAEAWALDLSSL